MSTERKRAGLRANTSIPERHLRMAEFLFDPERYEPDFDYYPQSLGYIVEKREKCKVDLKEKTDDNNDGRPDVDCKAGLVKTPLKVLGSKLEDEPIYKVTWDMSPWNSPVPTLKEPKYLDLKQKLKLGHVIEVMTLLGPTELKGEKDRNIPAHLYQHSMLVSSPVERIGEKEWKFQVFHSQREKKGPEYSWVTVKWGPLRGTEGNIEALFVTIDTCKGPDPFKVLTIPQIGDPFHRHYEMDTLFISGIGTAVKTECIDKYDNLEDYIVRDPVVFDLDGYGIHTVGLDADLHFDHDGDGFRELTGWVASGDGVLILDKNDNNTLDDGSELFGNNMILPNGKLAMDGFDALAYYDANGDGRIDANDSIWSELQIWQGHAYYPRYAGDPHELGVISRLDELGIAAIDLDYTHTNITDEAGNTEVQTGQFVWGDGSTGTMADYSFQTDMSDTELVDVVEVSPEVSSLPRLYGAGTLRDLHQAMMRDSSGELQSLVETFSAETNLTARESILEHILFKWSGSDTVVHNARGPFMDGRRVVVLEKIFGDPPRNPDQALAISWQDTYKEIFEFYYSELMSQTHLASLFDKLVYTWDEVRGEPKTDFSAVIPDILAELTNDPQQGKQLLSEFARTLRGSSSCSHNCYLVFRETMLEIDPELGWVFDTGGLPILEHPEPGSEAWNRVHLFGTHNAEAIMGVASERHWVLHGVNGDDVIYGTWRNETLRNQDGDAILVAGGGNDKIWAGDGADILDGGADNDILYGEAGNDTYIFRRGSGNDTIIDIDATEGNLDTIFLGSSLTPDDVTLKCWGNNLVLAIEDTTDTLTVKDFFRNDSTLNRVEQIQFMDGTLWTYEDIIEAAFGPTDGDDVIYGRSLDDEISGGGGDDQIFGQAGDDILHGDADDDILYGGDGDDTLQGGTGDDELRGGDGSDTYLIERGAGHDSVYDRDDADGTTNVVAFGEGILPEDIALERPLHHSTDLKLTIVDTGDTVTIKEWLQLDREGYPARYTVQTVTFADGTTWDPDQIKEMLVTGTDANEVLQGFSRADAMQGAGGDDTLFARDGGDTLDGGAGRDYLFGENGDDTLTGGDGDDHLFGGNDDDVLAGGAGDDILYGGTEGERYWGNGNDTYLFGRGAGHDKIYDRDGLEGNIDTILLADDLTPDDVTLQHTAEGLTLTINDTDDKLAVPYWFWNDSDEYLIERIEFADSTVWDVDTIKQLVLQGTSGDDLRVGYHTDDAIQGLAGNDFIHGSYGHDTLEGGAGSDFSSDCDGSDTLAYDLLAFANMGILQQKPVMIHAPC